MNRKLITIVLTATIILQCAVLAGEYINAVYPIWTGKEITLKTVPYDPRSLFRGNYARLRYDITRIETAKLSQERLRTGELVYVTLVPGPEGVYEFKSASIDKPADKEIFIRGRITSNWGNTYNINYGIEAFFAPKEKALALEKDLRSGGHAVVMVSGSGKAALLDVKAGKTTGLNR